MKRSISIKSMERGSIYNLVIFLFGLLFVLGGIIIKENNVLETVLLSIGTSLVATSIAAYINSKYIIHNSKLKTVVEQWKLEDIYESKAKMNEKSNNCLEKCKKNIDIIAIGMENFLAKKGTLLEELLQNGVKMRIITCDPSSLFLGRREEDEQGKNIGKMKLDIEKLQSWIKKQIGLQRNIEVRYYESYPAFSYLRIDNNLFWSDNLCKMPSQQSMAFEFYKNGKGFRYYSQYFEKIWGSDLCLKEEQLNSVVEKRNKTV
ncbi:hypothetical protein [[Clostridium] polysaccharolyticum]|uniref:Uncharacterized protein n=1 Tax=[Clostridium] polysaccharolyticum TaxID=29364 RepID=A0A1I0FVJ6_9FIRM|nr:hypothetical protein [[Clostridium] polysaccharolyticum]SET61494.1 hypothetical protein SAMN04487772_13722 [[Clostridium] polysaccharolyticum]